MAAKIVLAFMLFAFVAVSHSLHVSLKTTVDHTTNGDSFSAAMDTPSLAPFQQGIPKNALLLAVITAPGHFKARTAIRNVWQEYQHSSTISQNDLSGVSMKFFIGEVQSPNEFGVQLEDEQKAYGDIVRLQGFTEHYLNLTRKTLHTISWARSNNYQHMFKMDDDTFPRVENLITFLKGEPRPQYIYAGVFISNSAVVTNPQSKWYDADLYPYETYPDYASGPGYFLGQEVMKYIDDNKASLTLYRVEDAGVGVWTQNMPQIDRVNLNAMAYASTCDDTNGVIFVNPVNSEEMNTLIRNVRHGNMCADGFYLSECKQRPCLCHPLPNECDTTTGKGWSDFKNEKYEDLIPRLIQQSWNTTTTSTSSKIRNQNSL